MKSEYRELLRMFESGAQDDFRRTIAYIKKRSSLMTRLLPRLLELLNAAEDESTASSLFDAIISISALTHLHHRQRQVLLGSLSSPSPTIRFKAVTALGLMSVSTTD